MAESVYDFLPFNWGRVDKQVLWRKRGTKDLKSRRCHLLEWQLAVLGLFVSGTLEKKNKKTQKARARQSPIDLHPNSLLRKISELSSCHNITAVFASAVMLLDQQ